MATRSQRISKVVGAAQRKAQPWPGQANPGAPRTGGAKHHPILGPVKKGGQWDGAMRGVPLLGPVPKKPRR